ncbi:MAG TPA: hypothetical protein VFY20_00930 [Gemmatimonadales bacterium]|nr:hypothetical protein [Gemmatimonadales bacterium]
MTRALGGLVLLLTLPTAVPAQVSDSAAAERVRTESGIDPTRVISVASVALEVVDFPDDRFTSAVIPRIGIGAGAWSAVLDGRIAAISSGEAGAPLVTGFGDVGLTVARAFRGGRRHAFAAAAELVVPVGSEGVGSGAVAITPAFTWAWTLRPTLVIAAQSQWARSLLRASGAAEQSLLTLRGYVATFRPSGWFFVLEGRVAQDFVRERADVIVSPVAGRNIGKGLSLAGLFELPVSSRGRERYGMLARVGAQRAF